MPGRSSWFINRVVARIVGRRAVRIDVAEILYRLRNQRRRLLSEISLSSEFSAAELCELYGQASYAYQNIKEIEPATSSVARMRATARRPGLTV